MVNTEELKEDAAGNAQASTRASVRRRFARRGWGAVLVAALSLVFSLMSTPPASAYVGENTLRNWETGKCMSLSDGWIHQDDCNSGDRYQIWQPIYIGHGSYDIVTLKNVGANTCITNEANGGTGHVPCSTTSVYQQFRAEGSSWDKVRFVNLWSLKCIEGYNPYTVTGGQCDGTGHQLWKLGY